MLQLHSFDTSGVISCEDSANYVTMGVNFISVASSLSEPVETIRRPRAPIRHPWRHLITDRAKFTSLNSRSNNFPPIFPRVSKVGDQIAPLVGGFLDVESQTQASSHSRPRIPISRILNCPNTETPDVARIFSAAMTVSVKRLGTRSAAAPRLTASFIRSERTNVRGFSPGVLVKVAADVHERSGRLDDRDR